MLRLRKALSRIVQFLFVPKGRVSRRRYLLFFIVPFFVTVFGSVFVDQLICYGHPDSKLRATLVELLPEGTEILDGQKILSVKETCRGVRIFDVSFFNPMRFNLSLNIGGNTSAAVQLIVLLFWLWPVHAITIKRMHDSNFSGKWLLGLLGFVSLFLVVGFLLASFSLILLGTVFFLLSWILLFIACSLDRGDLTENRFGVPDLNEKP